MSTAANIHSLLEAHGGKLVRTKKHQVYRFEDGRTFTLASTPSDWRAELNQLSDLKRFLGITKRETTIGERREKKVRKPPTRAAVSDVKFSTNQPIQPLLGANGNVTQMREQTPLPAISYMPGAPVATNSNAVRGKVPVSMRRPQERHEAGIITRFTQEVINHCNFLARTKGQAAVEIYLRGAKQMVSHNDVVERAREVKEQSAMGPIEIAMREAEEKAAGFTAEVLRCKAEADKWTEIASSLRDAYDLTNAPAGNGKSKAKGQRGSGEGVGHGVWIGRVRETMSDGIPKSFVEIRQALEGQFPDLKARIYQGVKNCISTGKLTEVGGDKYKWTGPTE